MEVNVIGEYGEIEAGSNVERETQEAMIVDCGC